MQCCPISNGLLNPMKNFLSGHCPSLKRALLGGQMIHAAVNIKIDSEAQAPQQSSSIKPNRLDENQLFVDLC
jgi:hypothetical protein